MSKYKEILRYLMTTSLSGRAIAKSLFVGRDTVTDVKNRSEELGLKWEEVKNQDEHSAFGSRKLFEMLNSLVVYFFHFEDRKTIHEILINHDQLLPSA